MASDKMQSKLCERISELEKEVEGLKKNLSRYSEKIAEQEETIDAQDDKINFYVSRMNEHILKNKELEEQIEKMKCCDNCSKGHSGFCAYMGCVDENYKMWVLRK